MGKCLSPHRQGGVVGYSFRDEAVNERLRQAAAQAGAQRWIVIDRRNEADQDAFRAATAVVLAGVEPEYVFGGVEAVLPEVT